ncbi:heavy metal translocating P-type ATPase [Chelativorans sp. YIM 93263]|uniref:heavy metal translocating P-type ATPase n=1 Tax=Chelativorans sp. YIM 93263 TaxID=2906648 RepID=UPI00237A089B|nr:heavy metal translocating P-type ATPase [Chelativorans sp. YIM 93263]
MAETLTESRYRVSGMDCAGCARKIDTAVRRIAGVEDVSVSVASGTMTVIHEGTTQVQPAIEKQVKRLGYGAALLAPAGGEAEKSEGCGCCGGAESTGQAEPPKTLAAGSDEAEPSWWQQPRVRLTLMSGLALVAAFVTARFSPTVGPWAYDIAMLVGLVPVARRAFSAALAGTPFSIEMLMTIAAAGAAIIGASQEAAIVVFLFLVGELLEGVAAGRARAGIRALGKLVPKMARVERAGGGIEEVPAERLAVGDTVLVRPGDRIAADGEVLSGLSAIDEAPVTGESTPANKETGAAVFAGTVNGNGVLRVRVTAAAQDNTIARIIRLVEEAQERKAPTERFIDRFSRYYTPGVVLLAAMVAVLPPLVAAQPWLEWVYKGLTLLLIGCPCALVISTPAAIAAALSSGARRGLLMKGGAVLEQARSLRAIAFDKTGTLTTGRPKVTDIVPFGQEPAEVLRLAAALEQGSSHPLALAVLQQAENDATVIPSATDAAALGGKGVTGRVDAHEVFFGSPKAASVQLSPAQRHEIDALAAEGKTVSVLTINGALAGAIAMRDEPREDAIAGLKQLKAAGLRTFMLTGDNRRTAEAIGRDLGIEVRAEMLPEDKSRFVNELKSGGLKVGKVGDGINDAPALATADIGIAMGGGTDVALETADAAILHGRVSDVAAMIQLSNRTMANIRQNITIALGLKVIFLITTILGITGLWPAILADTGATVLVTANAMRLLMWRADPGLNAPTRPPHPSFGAPMRAR